MSKQDVQSVTPDQVMYMLFSRAIQELEGKILTVIDASISDPVQRKAIKDLVRPIIWTWAIESNISSHYEIKPKN